MNKNIESPKVQLALIQSFDQNPWSNYSCFTHSLMPTISNLVISSFPWSFPTHRTSKNKTVILSHQISKVPNPEPKTSPGGQITSTILINQIPETQKTKNKENNIWKLKKLRVGHFRWGSNHPWLQFSTFIFTDEGTQLFIQVHTCMDVVSVDSSVCYCTEEKQRDREREGTNIPWENTSSMKRMLLNVE